MGTFPAGRLSPALRQHRAQRIRCFHARIPDGHTGSPLPGAGCEPHRRMASEHHPSKGGSPAQMLTKDAIEVLDHPNNPQ